MQLRPGIGDEFGPINGQGVGCNYRQIVSHQGAMEISHKPGIDFHCHNVRASLNQHAGQRAGARANFDYYVSRKRPNCIDDSPRDLMIGEKVLPEAFLSLDQATSRTDG
jgi:hypothetical protein